MEAAVLAEIGRLRWRVWTGKEWGRARGLPTTGLWPQVGRGAPAAGRPAAHRERGRGEPYSGGLSVWEEAQVAQGGCRGRVELRGGGGLRRNGRRSGTFVGRTGRAAGVCCGLRGAGRCATFIGRAQRRDARLQCRGTAAILTCVCTRLQRTAGHSAAVRRGTRSHAAGSRSQATGAKGNWLLVPRGSRAWPARTPRRRNARRRDARQAAGALAAH
jgi:hypothetical protein